VNKNFYKTGFGSESSTGRASGKLRVRLISDYKYIIYQQHFHD
jgi:hypothetical protein